jgi:hypothetical protein
LKEAEVKKAWTVTSTAHINPEGFHLGTEVSTSSYVISEFLKVKSVKRNWGMLATIRFRIFYRSIPCPSLNNFLTDAALLDLIHGFVTVIFYGVGSLAPCPTP